MAPSGTGKGTLASLITMRALICPGGHYVPVHDLHWEQDCVGRLQLPPLSCVHVSFLGPIWSRTCSGFHYTLQV